MHPLRDRVYENPNKCIISQAMLPIFEVNDTLFEMRAVSAVTARYEVAIKADYKAGKRNSPVC